MYYRLIKHKKLIYTSLISPGVYLFNVLLGLVPKSLWTTVHDVINVVSSGNTWLDTPLFSLCFMLKRNYEIFAKYC